MESGDFKDDFSRLMGGEESVFNTFIDSHLPALKNTNGVITSNQDKIKRMKLVAEKLNRTKDNNLTYISSLEEFKEIVNQDSKTSSNGYRASPGVEVQIRVYIENAEKNIKHAREIKIKNMKVKGISGGVKK